MNKQKGMATLLTSVLLTVIISLLVFWGSRGSVIEQQSANNTYLTQVAFQNAEQGRARFMSNIKAYLIAFPTKSLNEILSSSQDTTNSAPSAAFTVAFQMVDAVTATLFSTGTSIGGTTRKVSQRIKLTAGGAAGPGALVSIGNIKLQSGSSFASSATAGGTITGNGDVGTDGSGTSSAASQQYSDEFRVALLDHNGNLLTDAAGNPVTRGMTTDEYFIYYFGGFCPVAKAAYATDIRRAADCKNEAKATVAAHSLGYICASDCGSKTEDDKLQAAYDAGKRIFWLDGGGIDHKQDFGTAASPVLLFIMNNASGSTAVKLNAGTKIFGVVYVDIASTKTIIGCSCKAEHSVIGITTKPVQVNDPSKPIYTSYDIYTEAQNQNTQGAIQCDKAAGCTDGATPPNTIQHNKYYTKSVGQKITGYVQMDKPDGSRYTSAATWGTIAYSLNPNQAAACTVAACTAAPSASICTPSSDVALTTAVGDLAMCSYPVKVPAVSGVDDTPVEIEVLGDWNDNGTGNATFNGSVISSGNITVTGGAEHYDNSTVMGNEMFGEGLGQGFATKPPTLAVAQNSWSDMLN